MRGFSKGAAVALVVCAVGGAVFAGDGSLTQRAAALDALNAMHMAESMQTGADAALTRSLNAQIQAHPEQAQLFQAMKAKMIEVETRRLPEMVGIMADVYAAEFTPAELKAITAFYNSPVGQKLTGTRTALNQKAAPAMQVWVRGVLKDVGDEMAKKLNAPDK